MIKETVKTAETIENAIKLACEELKRSEDEILIEVLETPKKGIFGKVKSMAKIKASLKKEPDKVDIVNEYIDDIMKNFGFVDINQKVIREDNCVKIILEGDNLGSIIGRRGETLDAFQYLATLVANKNGGNYLRVIIDSGDFRSKRESTLCELAKKISAQVMKTGKSMALEPMNPYERRIIHATVSDISGVYSKSIGDYPNRRVIIASENSKKASYGKKSYPPANTNKDKSNNEMKKNNKGDSISKNNKPDNNRRKNSFDKNYEIKKPVTTKPTTYDFEKEFLKKGLGNDKNLKLYSKLNNED